MKREEKESDKTGDVEEEIPLEALGGLATNDSRSQNRILQQYIARNRRRKRKVNVLVGATIVFLTISMGLGVYIFTTQVICPKSPGHQDISIRPSLSTRNSPSVPISPANNNQDSNQRITK